MIDKYFNKLPYKKKWVIFTFIIWNLLFIPVFIEFLKNVKDEVNINSKIIYPLAFAIISSLLLIFLKKIREVVLKKGKTFKDIQKDCFLILGVSLFVIYVSYYIN